MIKKIWFGVGYYGRLIKRDLLIEWCYNCEFYVEKRYLKFVWIVCLVIKELFDEGFLRRLNFVRFIIMYIRKFEVIDLREAL